MFRLIRAVIYGYTPQRNTPASPSHECSCRRREKPWVSAFVEVSPPWCWYQAISSLFTALWRGRVEPPLRPLPRFICPVRPFQTQASTALLRYACGWQSAAACRLGLLRLCAPTASYSQLSPCSRLSLGVSAVGFRARWFPARHLLLIEVLQGGFEVSFLPVELYQEAWKASFPQWFAHPRNSDSLLPGFLRGRLPHVPTLAVFWLPSPPAPPLYSVCLQEWRDSSAEINAWRPFRGVGTSLETGVVYSPSSSETQVGTTLTWWNKFAASPSPPGSVKWLTCPQ